MITPGMNVIQNKNVGDFKLNILNINSGRDVRVLTIWSKSFGREVFNSNMMKKNEVKKLYDTLNTEPKIKNFLQNKSRLSPSMLRSSW